MPGEMVSVVDQHGRVIEIPSELAPTFQGRAADPVEIARAQHERDIKGDIGIQIGAGALGALSGVSSGLADPAIALAASGGGVSLEEAQQAVAQGLPGAAPVAYGAGQVAGALGQAYLTGGTSLAAEGALAARLGGSLAARAGAGLAVGAAEGALQGGAYALSRGLLDDGELTAERVLADAGMGALFGGAVGGAVAGVGGVAGAAARAAIGEEGGLATRVARENTLRAIGSRGTDIRALGSVERQGAVADTVRKYVFRSGPRQGEQLLKAGRTTEGMLEPLSDAVEDSSAALGALKAKAFQAAATIPEAAPDAAAMLRRIDEEVIAPLRGSLLPADRAEASFVERQLAPLRQRIEGAEGVAPNPPTLEELDQVRAALYSYVHPPKGQGGGIAVAKRGAEHIEKTQRILSDEVKSAGERALAAAGDAEGAASFRAGYTELNHLLSAKEIAEKAQTMNLANMPLSLTSQLAGAAGLTAGASMVMSGNLGGLLLGPGASLAHKFVKEHGSSALAVLAGRFERQSKRIDSAIGAIARIKPLARAAPRTVASQEGARRKDRAYSRARFDEVHGKVLAARQAGPLGRAELAARSAEPLAAEHPQIAAAVSRKNAAIIDLALGKLPQALVGKGLQTHLETPRIPAPEQMRFLAYMYGLEDPVSVIEDVSRGELDRDALEAVKTAYPRLWDETRNEVMKRVADLEEPLAYDALMPLALAFDFEADARSHGPSIAAAQAAMVPPEQDGKGGEIDPGIAQQARTQGQRLEST